MSHSSPKRPGGDPHYFGFFPRNVEGRPEKIPHSNFVFLKKNLTPISRKITEKTENDTVGRYWFGWNLDSKFYERKQIFLAMGESGRGFGLKFMRKWKLKKIEEK